MLTRRQVQNTVTLSRDAQAKIRDRVTEAKHILDSEHVAWGQFLDGDRNQQQFGVYGTSAAIAILAASGVDPGNPDITKAAATIPFIVDSNTALTRHDDNDVSSTFKVAAALEAVRPEEDNLNPTPEAALYLIEGIVDHKGWGNYYISSTVRDNAPRIEPTGVALLALSRVQGFKADQRCLAILAWLADEIAPRGESPPESDALSLLVLARYSAFSQQVMSLPAASAACLGRLRRWRKGARNDSAIHAEYHYEIPGNVSADNQYVFFPLHVLVALAFLSCPTSSSSDRSWAANIVREVANSAIANKGYKVRGKVCTVDQLWTFRLLTLFVHLAESSPASFLSKPLNILDSRNRTIGAILALLVFGTAGIVISLQQHSIGVHTAGYVVSTIAFGLLVVAIRAGAGSSAGP